MGMHDDVVNEFKAKVEASIEGLRRELSKIRTGRASLALLDGIKLDYYGTSTPLNGVGSLAVADPRLITIKPWDKSTIPAIEKAIIEANLGLTPQNDGEMVRLPIPALTEERRREISKMVKAKGEEYKVAVRNERRDANEMLKEIQKEGEISEDDLKRALERVQKETDAGIVRVDEVVVRKEKDVMEV